MSFCRIILKRRSYCFKAFSILQNWPWVLFHIYFICSTLLCFIFQFRLRSQIRVFKKNLSFCQIIPKRRAYCFKAFSILQNWPWVLFHIYFICCTLLCFIFQFRLRSQIRVFKKNLSFCQIILKRRAYCFKAFSILQNWPWDLFHIYFICSTLLCFIFQFRLQIRVFKKSLSFCQIILKRRAYCFKAFSILQNWPWVLFHIYFICCTLLCFIFQFRLRSQIRVFKRNLSFCQIILKRRAYCFKAFSILQNWPWVLFHIYFICSTLLCFIFQFRLRSQIRVFKRNLSFCQIILKRRAYCFKAFSILQNWPWVLFHIYFICSTLLCFIFQFRLQIRVFKKNLSFCQIILKRRAYCFKAFSILQNWPWVLFQIYFICSTLLCFIFQFRLRSQIRVFKKNLSFSTTFS